ncbi:unnamed protein product [Chrysoparadoxa australica]
MKKYQRFLLPMVLLLAFRAIALSYLKEASGGTLSEKCPITYILRVLPFYYLVSYGCYALASVGLGLLCFNDCNSALEELQSDIKAANKKLQAQGILKS